MLVAKLYLCHWESTFLDHLRFLLFPSTLAILAQQVFWRSVFFPFGLFSSNHIQTQDGWAQSANTPTSFIKLVPGPFIAVREKRAVLKIIALFLRQDCRWLAIVHVEARPLQRQTCRSCRQLHQLSMHQLQIIAGCGLCHLVEGLITFRERKQLLCAFSLFEIYI